MIEKAIEEGNNLKEHYSTFELKINEILCYNQKEEFQNKINWPILKFPDECEFDKEKKINYIVLEEIIWYSRIRLIIKNFLENNQNNNLYPKELIRYPEASPILTFFVDYLIQKNENFNECEMDEKQSSITREIKSILNAIVIYKIYERIKNEINNKEDLSNFFFNSFNSIIDYINKLAKRDILETYEIQWGYEKIHEFSLDFILYIPKLEKKDIFSLFLFDFQNTIPESEIQKGPLLDDPLIIQKLKKLKERIDYNSKGFKDIFFEIVHIILEKNFKSDEDLKEFLNKNENENNKYEDFYIFFLFMKRFDNKRNENKLIWDDYKAITYNWIENNEFMKNYPSFYYWLCKHYRYFQIIKEELNNGLINNFKNDSIPLFAIFLRIITSKNFVIYEPNEHKFSENLNKKIVEKFIEKKNINLKFLINLTLDHVFRNKRF